MKIRILSLLLTALIAAGSLLVTGCKSGGGGADIDLDNQGKTLEQWLEIDRKNPVTIEIQVADMTTPPASDSAVMKKITEKTGVTVKFTGTDNDRLQMLLASRKFPDAVVVNRSTTFYNYLDSGMMMNLEPLLQSFAPTVYNMAAADSDDNLVKLFKNKDVELLYLTENKDLLREGERHPEDATDPNRVQDELPWHSTFYVQYPLVKEVYGKEINSYASFMAALDAFKAKAADGTYAISMDKDSAGDILWAGLSSYGYKCMYKGGLYVTLDGENYTYGLKAAKAKEFLLFMNKLFRDGYIDPEGPVQSTDQFIRKMNKAKVFAFVGNYYNIYEANKNLATSKTQNHISYIPQKVVADGVSQVYQYNAAYTGSAAFMIPNTSKNAARIARLFEYLYSDEGSVLHGWGIEGEDYIINKDGKRDLNEEIYQKIKSSKDYNLTRGIRSFYQIINLPTYTSDGQPAFARFAPYYSSDAGLDARDAIIRKDAVYNWHDDWKGTFWSDITETDIVFLAETDAAIASSTCAQYIKDYINRIIMAPTEAQAVALYDEAVSKMNAYGIEAWEKEVNAQIKAKREALK